MTIPRLIGLYLVSLILSSFIFAGMENKTFFEGLYWSSVTATTIGYGDLLPTHTFTRIWMIVFAHFQVFFCIPSVVVLLMGKVIQDQHKFDHQEQEEIKQRLRLLCEKQDIKLPVYHDSPPS